MKKKILIAILLAMNSTSIVSAAENPSAEKYRQMFASPNFYFEYKDKTVNRIIASNNGQRMERAALSSQMITLFSVLNPLGALFGGGDSDRFPEALNVGDKYFQFADEKYATMLDASHMNDEKLNPREGWSSVKSKLALPTELAPLAWDDPYREHAKSFGKPEYRETFKKTVHRKEYSCDRYISDVANGLGNREASLAYDLCYDEDGELKFSQMIILRGGKDYLVNELEIDRILDKVPEKKFYIRDKAKAYSAGFGDMNDLLETPIDLGFVKDIIGEGKS